MQLQLEPLFIATCLDFYSLLYLKEKFHQAYQKRKLYA